MQILKKDKKYFKRCKLRWHHSRAGWTFNPIYWCVYKKGQETETDTQKRIQCEDRSWGWRTITVGQGTREFWEPPQSGRKKQKKFAPRVSEET